MITLNNSLNKFIFCAALIPLIAACAQTPNQYGAGHKNSTLLCDQAESRSAKLCRHQDVVKQGDTSSDRQNFQPQTNLQTVEAKAEASSETQQATRQYQQLWPRLASELQFEALAGHADVENQEELYSAQSYYLAKISKRAARYLYYIIENIEERGLPSDLALLPFVESAFDPFAYSHGRASGLWQFVPNTAKHLGIDQNWWYDGRRDVITATDSALDYLTDLNRRFDGDWLLTLAAYNAGAGTVNKAIRLNKKKGLPTDFWSLRLPKETKNYIPKMLALVKIFKNPASYNLTLPPVPNKPHFIAVNTGSQLDLAQAAKLADISVDELYRLNPGFNRWATAPEGPHRLLIPQAKAKIFASRLAEISPRDHLRWQQYTIQAGDNLVTISRRYHVDVATLRASNKLDNDILKIGNILLIPDAGNGVSPHKGASRGLTSSEASQIEYKVRSGDTISGIAKKHGVSSEKIFTWNKLASNSIIKPGQRLILWAKASQQSAKGIIRKVGYKVRNGDSLRLIASRFNLRIRDIVEWNSIKASQYLRPGQSLTLYVDITRADL
ncbi:MAG: membrane-bound lytic murein transglycosylase D [Zhongshania sp.]|jgi:membrane-bound lytic murein transglycosylase D